MATQQTTNVDKVTNLLSVDSLAYMRSIDIEFSAADCKPKCQLYAMFDGINASSYIVPASGPDKDILGGRLYADEFGNCSGTFRVPEKTFHTGKKEFVLTENPVPTEEAINGALYGYCVAEFESTGVKEIYQSTITITTTKYVEVPRVVDPLAQSFFTDGVKNGVFVTSLELFFWTKDTDAPVIVELREMINGYPSNSLATPKARVSLSPSQVKLSDDGSIPTKFTFENPLYLQEDKDFCFVIMSMSNSYNVFTCTMGERSFETQRIVFDQPLLGSLFKSQNNQTWNASQYEDIKFKMYRASFDTTAEADVVLFASSPPVLIEPWCLSTTAGSKVVRAELTFDHNLELGNKFTISVEPDGTWNGISSANLTGTFSTSSVLSNRAFEFLVNSNATATGNIEHGGFVHQVIVDNPGLGYESSNPPVITFQDPPAGGVRASAEAIIENGAITRINITNHGKGYLEAPSITITGSTGTGATARASLETRMQIITNRSYSMVTPAIPNVVLGNTYIDAFLDYTKGNFEGGNITSYTPGETTKISIQGKNWLTENAWLCNTANEKAMLNNNLSTKFTLKMRSDAENISPVISLNSIRAMFSGNLINNQNDEDILADASSGSIDQITLATGGAGYTAPPTITFVNQYGCQGTGAAADATISGGTVTNITLVNPGTGYIKPPFIVFSGAATVPASAVATLVPFNSELRAINGTARSRYISKIVTLASAAESARVFVEAYSGHKSNFDVYLRTSLKASGEVHTDKEWTLMKVDVETNQSTVDQQFVDYEFYLDHIEKYDMADLKIVFRSTQPIDVPSINNYRAILTV